MLICPPEGMALETMVHLDDNAPTKTGVWQGGPVPVAPRVENENMGRTVSGGHEGHCEGDKLHQCCDSCGVPFIHHYGVIGTCAALQSALKEVARLQARLDARKRGK